MTATNGAVCGSRCTPYTRVRQAMHGRPVKAVILYNTYPEETHDRS